MQLVDRFGFCEYQIIKNSYFIMNTFAMGLYDLCDCNEINIIMRYYNIDFMYF